MAHEPIRSPTPFALELSVCGRHDTALFSRRLRLLIGDVAPLLVLAKRELTFRCCCGKVSFQPLWRMCIYALPGMVTSNFS